MSVRVRLVLVLLVMALVPLLFFAIGVRREVDRRLSAGELREARRAASGLRQGIDAESRRLAVQLQGIGRDLARDPRTVLALQGNDAARAWLIDYAGTAMPTTGLDLLVVADTDGTLLSVGQFRNRYGTRAVLPPAGPDPIAVSARTSDGRVLALARTLDLAVAAYPLRLLGGVALDSSRAAALLGDSLLGVQLQLPGQPGPAVAGLDTLRLPYWSLDLARPASDSMAIVVWRRASNLAALREGLAYRLGGALGIAGIIALVLALVLASGLSRPLRDLTARAEAVDLAHLDEDFASGRTDEVGRLSNALAAMLHRLRTSTSQLREAERRAATGDLARQVNHDVKNGLAPIRHVLRHLSQVARDDPPQLAAVYRERESTLEASVNHLDALARSYATLGPVAATETVLLVPMLRDVLRDIGDARARLVGAAKDDGPAVRADAVRLRRIVHNLVANGLESLEGPDGTVEVIVNDGGDDMAGFTVTDHGRGMTAAGLNRAFADFYTTKPGGTGLGLSSVRRLVMELGGRIKASSAPGQGSSFEVWLPRATSRNEGTPA